MAASEQLPVRVFQTLRYSARNRQQADAAIELIEQNANLAFSNDLQSGIIGLGEHIYTPMLDRANHRQPWPDDVWQPFSDIAHAAAQHGWTVHEHVKSDVTAKQFLSLITELAIQYPEIKNKRWTLAHVDAIKSDTIETAKELGVALGVHSQSMMKPRMKNLPPLGDIERSDVLWGLGSDGAVVAPINPFTTIRWVITGKDIANRPMWDENQRISREAAIRAHTISNAKLLFIEEDLGSLEVGKIADLIVLDKDIMTVDEVEIGSIRPIMTMTNGEIVHSVD